VVIVGRGKKLLDISLPDELESQREAVLKDLEMALGTYKQETRNKQKFYRPVPVVRLFSRRKQTSAPRDRNLL